MNVSQIDLYLYQPLLFQSKNKKGWNGMLDLAIVGQSKPKSFTLPFLLTVEESSRMQTQLRAIWGKVAWNLYSSIVLDCQTKTAFSCSEDCIAYKTCKLRKKQLS